jgi:menaquinone-9 beta-reductase
VRDAVPVKRPLVIGAGVAGSAAAIALAKAGSAPLIIERSRETGDALCGGFLSWATLHALGELGIDREALGGHPVGLVRIHAGKQVAEADVPAPGMGLSRHRLDSVLLDHALRSGAAIERGVSVRSADAAGAETGDGARVEGSALFLATGKHALRGHPRPAPGSAGRDPVAGLRQRLGAGPRLAGMIDGAVELFLFDRGYAGLVLQEDGTANLCLAVHKSRLAEAGGQPAELIGQWCDQSAALAARYDVATSLGAIDAIGAVPYGFVAPGGEADAPWRLGDQAACIPSLAGEGMGIAVSSALSAVASWRQGGHAGEWQTRFARRTAVPMLAARTIWAAAENSRLSALALPLLRRMPGLTRGIARLTRVAG